MYQNEPTRMLRQVLLKLFIRIHLDKIIFLVVISDSTVDAFMFQQCLTNDFFYSSWIMKKKFKNCEIDEFKKLNIPSSSILFFLWNQIIQMRKIYREPDYHKKTLQIIYKKAKYLPN